MFISTEVEYIRRVDLEGDDSNLMVVDLVGDNLYSILIPPTFFHNYDIKILLFAKHIC